MLYHNNHKGDCYEHKQTYSLSASFGAYASVFAPAGLFVFAEGAMNAGNTVYVDQTNGSDETGDGTEAKPVQTIEKAVELLEAGDKTADGYVYLLDDYSAVYNGEKSGAEALTSVLPAHTRHIIITGNVGNKPTWELRFKPLIYKDFFTPTANRHGAASLYPLTNGPSPLMPLRFIRR